MSVIKHGRHYDAMWTVNTTLLLIIARNWPGNDELGRYRFRFPVNWSSPQVTQAKLWDGGAAMYGLVNTAVADLARTVGGEPAWQAICAHAQMPPVAFVGMTSYPDEVTYRLVDGASAVLGLTPEQVLTAFGRHWVQYTGQQGWGPLLQSAGGSLPEVLGGLDALHARVRLLMPELRPPSFSCVELTPTTLRLEYWSDRPGLAPMVIGLVEGLAELLGDTATATHVQASGDGHDYDTFLVKHSRAPA